MLNFYLSLIETEEDKTLFAKIYEENRQNMVKYAVHLVKDEGNAEDIVHEVFLFVVKSGVDKIRGVEKEGNLWAYLSAAVRNQSYTFLKKQNEVELLEPEVNEYIGSMYACDRMSQESDYEYLVETIRGLKPTYADVLYFALVQEMPSDKIAKLLGLTPAAVRKRISRGKDLLQEKLGKDFLA